MTNFAGFPKSTIYLDEGFLEAAGSNEWLSLTIYKTVDCSKKNLQGSPVDWGEGGKKGEVGTERRMEE